LDKDAQREFLGTLGAVSAAFLTLYFTAISVVVSTAYARTPGNVRSLIIKEEVGSAYFGFLAQFAGVITVMLNLLAFGHQLGSLNTLFAGFLCLFSIFGFVFLGVRAFEYFDPTVLVSLLNRRVLEKIQSVTPDGYQWTDQSFQSHHQRQASELLGEAVKPIGWNARGSFNDCVLFYYWIHLMIRFERFKIELRDAMLNTLNDGIQRVGQKIGFNGKITIDGLPTLADVDAAIVNLKSGTMAFSDVMKPFERH
jgi:hypothetical protein